MKFLHVYDSKDYKPTGHNYSVDFGEKAKEELILFPGTEVQENYELPQISRELYCFDPPEVIVASPNRGPSKHVCDPFTRDVKGVILVSEDGNFADIWLKHNAGVDLLPRGDPGAPIHNSPLLM